MQPMPYGSMAAVVRGVLEAAGPVHRAAGPTTSVALAAGMDVAATDAAQRSLAGARRIHLKQT